MAMEASKKAWHVILAEDDEDLRTLVGQALRKEGFGVTECQHGLALLDQLHDLESPAFDLIISDIRMPGVTGMSIVEGLSEYDGVPPIILITAFGDDETRAVAKLFGAAAMINKPFKMEELISKVRETLVTQ